MSGKNNIGSRPSKLEPPMTLDYLIGKTGFRLTVVMQQQGALSLAQSLIMMESAGLPAMMTIAPSALQLGNGHEIVSDGRLYEIGMPVSAAHSSKLKSLLVNQGYVGDALMIEQWDTFYITEVRA